jgi:hypothetical protein
MNIMRSKTVISWTQASSFAEKHKEDIIINREQALIELRSTHLEVLDAQDVQYLAKEAGVMPNEARKLCIKPEDSYQRFMAEVHSFDNDCTDDLIDYFS